MSIYLLSVNMDNILMYSQILYMWLTFHFPRCDNIFNQCSSTNVRSKNSITHDKDTVPKRDCKVFMNLLNRYFYLQNFFNILHKTEFNSQLS